MSHLTAFTFTGLGPKNAMLLSEGEDKCLAAAKANRF
jgi:hypothetical protein